MRKGVLLLIIACQGGYLSGLLKIAYSRPRPYWDDDRIDAVNCSEEFGNPSGHTLLSLLLYGFFLSFVFKGKWFKVKLGIFTGLVLIIGYDRIYLGVHSVWQVLLGWIYGFSLLVTWVYFVNVKGFQIYSKLKSLWLVQSVFFGGIVLEFVISLLLYLYRKDIWDDKWSENIKEVRFNQKCDKDDDN